MVTLATSDAFDAGNKTFGTHWIGAGSATFGCPGVNTFPGYRAGCLGNWDTDSTTGVISQSKTFPIEQIGMTASNQQGALNSPIGLGLVIHANTDPCNGTSTLYGARLAGGVIGIANLANNNATAYTTGKTSLTATCRLIGTNNGTLSWGGIRGSVWFRQNSLSSITIRANISGIDLGTNLARSMHIHDFGDLFDQADGLKTGGHWNPFRANHSLPNDEPRHAGDLGRITVTSNGNIWYEYTLTSTGNTPYHPLLSDPYSVLGRGMILHAGRDEGCAAPTSNGNAGTRTAQCVIGLARDEVWDELSAVWPTLSMPAQVGRAACSAPTVAPAAAPVSAPFVDSPLDPPAAGVPVPAAVPTAISTPAMSTGPTVPPSVGAVPTSIAPVAPKTPVRAGSGAIFVPSILCFLLAAIALLF
jgi:superoxide dismutase, Cu-Zn family